MKKVFVSKNDSIAEVVEKVISEPEVEIVLVVPKNTLLQDSVSNFHLLKRESDAAGKLITVESVDEDILSLAKAARVEAIHPLFRKKKSSSLSDIVPKGKRDEEDDYEEEPEPTPKKSARTLFKKKIVEEEIPEPESDLDQTEEDEELVLPGTVKKSWQPKIRFKGLIAVGVIVLLLVPTFFLFYQYRKADVAIAFNTRPFEYQGAFTASVNSSEIDPATNNIPAEIFSQSKNYTGLYPASGRSNVSEKATGKLLIYNAYSSQKQVLVVNTRFQTPDGKIFRLQNQVEVPGAQIKDGKIIPSSIETLVIADKAGPAYNLGAIEKLTIPGFKDPEKFNGFYGSLISSSGGFIGEKAVPTEKDITDAKKKTEETLRQSLEKSLTLEKPQGFKILDEATEVVITKISVNKITNEKGEFSVFGEAEFRAIGFKEESLKSLLISKAENSDGLVFKTITLNYTDPQKNFTKKEFKFSLDAKGVLTQSFDSEKFVQGILGLSVDEAQAEIRKLKGLSVGKISISPPWLKTLPDNIEKIQIQVD